MRERFLSCFFILLVSLPYGIRAQSVALSFDDGFDPRTQPQAPAWNAAILAALSAAHVHSILFAAGSRVDSPAGLALVRDWGRGGHEIANHTYSHLGLGSGDVDVAGFARDVEKNERLLKDLPGWTRRFRFPYLSEGETAAKRDGVRRWLRRHGYLSGAVSIDASDWYYNDRYLAWKSLHENADPAPFRSAYLHHLWGRARYYDGLSQNVLGRSARHVLLLHANALNAAFLPDVIAMFKAGGWQVIDTETAFGDPLYSLQPQTLPAGQSVLWSLAKAKGVPDLRYPAEDDVYEKPQLDAAGL